MENVIWSHRRVEKDVWVSLCKQKQMLDVFLTFSTTALFTLLDYFKSFLVYFVPFSYLFLLLCCAEGTLPVCLVGDDCVGWDGWIVCVFWEQE